MKYIRGIFIALIAVIICLGLYKYFAFPFLEAEWREINLKYEQNQILSKSYFEKASYTGGIYGGLVTLVTQNEIDQIKDNIYTSKDGKPRRLVGFGSYCYEDINRKDYLNKEAILKEILLRNEECSRQGITEDMPVRVDKIEHLQQLRNLIYQQLTESDNSQSKYPFYYVLTNYYDREHAITWVLILAGILIFTEGTYYTIRKRRERMK